MTNENEDDYGTMQQMRLWDKKLARLDDEILYYVYMRAESIMTDRSNDE